jgi:hypothetical protein
MRIKPGVHLDGTHYALWWAAAVWDYLRHANGLSEGTVTGGREAPDLGPASAARAAGTDAHAHGLAFDLRTNDLPGGPQGRTAYELAQALQDAIGNDFRVVVESDHVHVIVTT